MWDVRADINKIKWKGMENKIPILDSDPPMSENWGQGRCFKKSINKTAEGNLVEK